MFAHKAAYVIGGLEVSVFGMAFFTTERVVDLGMADQTVRHLRHSCRRHLIRLLQATVTGPTGVLCLQVPANVAWWLKVRFLVDRSGDHRSCIAHLQVKRVVEM